VGAKKEAGSLPLSAPTLILRARGVQAKAQMMRRASITKEKWKGRVIVIGLRGAEDRGEQ
jgi:hypothetical protein